MQTILECWEIKKKRLCEAIKQKRLLCLKIEKERVSIIKEIEALDKVIENYKRLELKCCD